MVRYILMLTFALFAVGASAQDDPTDEFRLNDREYFELAGVSVMSFQDFYPDGHQGGVTIIQHGERVAANGDIRLEATPGQWSPMPKQDRREVVDGEIITWLSYPDPSKNRTGFNPIEYPDLEFSYQVRVRPEGDAVRVVVDLDEPLPEDWIGKVGFNLEIYPTAYFGKSWQLGGETGLFPRQPNGPMRVDGDGELQAVPLASGPRLTVAPESETLQFEVESLTGKLILVDGRNKHNNGWFIVRSTVPAGATDGAIEWLLRPHVDPEWRYGPVVQVSQVGYHPAQKKVAVIELDPRDDGERTARLVQVSAEKEAWTGGHQGDPSERVALEAVPAQWAGEFLRYDYRQFDFSDVTEPGMYVIEYGDVRTHAFEISEDVFDRGVWQPTLEFFLPVQMCHMRVEQQYRTWHGLCHMDDARMAPPDSNHFDGYVQGPDLLTHHEPGEVVPGLNVGGWHDAGDDDLRIESQADEVWILASAYELFDVDHDDTSIDQGKRLAQIHVPDGEPDLLQQVEHGVLSILGGYEALGRLYRGIIVPTLEQYRMISDWSNQTDNLFYDPTLEPDERTATRSGVKDDRMVFTEEHPGHEHKGIAALAIAGRVLREHNPELARRTTAAAEELWLHERDPERGFGDRIAAAVELLLTTEKSMYGEFLLDHQDRIVENIGGVGWSIGRALPLVDDASFEEAVRTAVEQEFARIAEAQTKNPYGVPYEPYIWGAGWGIQDFGVKQYFLYRGFPDVVTPEYMLNALNFVAGVHPGSNTKSFASGVGANSVQIAYGITRDDWSFIPGGVVSGTALIRPDFPELKEYPYLWQQAEYVMGGGASNFMFLVLAAQDVLGR